MESEKLAFFYYQKGENHLQVRKQLVDVYGGDVLTVDQFTNFDLAILLDFEDALRPERSAKTNKVTIKAFIDANWGITTREIAKRSNLAVQNHLKGPGLTSKLDIWVSHVLTPKK